MDERLRLWLERGESGYRLRDAATGEPVRWEDPRVRVVAAAGVSYRPEALPDPSFDPGKRLALVPEPANEHDPNAVAIWNAERTLQLGYVPAAVAPELAGDEQALSLWRVEGGLRVLIVPADAWVGGTPVGSAAVAYEFKLPDLGEGLTEGEVARWLVTEGQELAEDDPLVEIQTDKTTVEIPSPAAGTVSRILVAEGEVVPVGTVLVVIGADGGEPPAASPEPSAPEVVPDRKRASVYQSQARVQATPIVRRIAQELGVDLASLSGTGPNGRITEADVRSAGGELVSDRHKPSEGRREPVRGVRRQIVEHLTKAHREVPAVTFVEECDFTDVDLQRLLPLTLKAVAASLAEYPELNARLEGDEIVYLDRYDLGVAVQTDQGLVVPVVRGCDTGSLEELADEVKRLAGAAGDGTLKPEELRGSTFTITSAGKLGGLVVTPLVNHPEVGILGIHRIGPRPVVRDDEIVVRRIGNVSVTFDHRVVDGARAAAFTLDVIARLESGLSS